MLEEELLDWVKNVVAVKKLMDSDDCTKTFVSTYAMIQEVDSIIAKAFDRERVLDY